MAGTKIGGERASRTNRAKYGDDFYKRIGEKGGKNGNTGGFAKAIPCSCETIKGRHYKRECAGKRGGTISRRPPVMKMVNLTRKTEA